MGAPVVHFEIGCRNLQQIRDFYVNLFDWETSDFGGMHMVNTCGAGGIHGHISALGHEPHKYVTVYAQVDDVDEYLAKVEKLGGKVVVPKTEVPQTGWFAWFADPDGNTFGLWKPMQPR
jgi:predicted enzyme related to lactoylglutathione lyase